MKKFLALCLIALCVSVTSLDAQAAFRFGGGSSFGRSAPSLFQKAPATRPMLNRQAKPNQKAQSAKGTAAQGTKGATAASPMRGFLMGAAAALGISALASALGLSEELVHVVMMVLLFFAIYFVVKLLFGALLGAKYAPVGNKRQSAQDTMYESAAAPSYGGYDEQNVRAGSAFDTLGSRFKSTNVAVPEGFDIKGFEKVARENFMRLQKAWDKNDVNQIADFVTDDVFITLTHQLHERGAHQQVSEVIDLTVKLLGIVEETTEHVAIVEMTGAMKINGAFEEVKENWILTHAKEGNSGWLLAGIEQR